MVTFCVIIFVFLQLFFNSRKTPVRRQYYKRIYCVVYFTFPLLSRNIVDRVNVDYKSIKKKGCKLYEHFVSEFIFDPVV